MPDSPKPQRFHAPPDELRDVGILPITFVEAYKAAPGWEIGRPQPFVESLVAANELAGRVLDIGCGTGENALFLAASGREVTAVDLVPDAIARAQEKVADRQLNVDFRIGDVLALESTLRDCRPFDAAVDSGTFHVFSDADRPRYVRGAHAVLRPGAALHLVCFSEAETRPGGPRRVTADELCAAFANGWRLDALTPIRYAATNFDGGARAWHATLTRL